MSAKDRLMLRIRGFKIGTNAAAIPQEIEKDPDFLLGHAAGRKAIQEFYAIQSQDLGAELTILREWESKS